MTTDNVRLASGDDTQALSFILLKMMSERGLTPPVSGDNLTTRLAQDGPGGNGKFDCLIAFHRMRPSGLLMYSQAYDLCALASYAQVHHLYVADQAQGNGLKNDMLVFLSQLALEEGWSHIDWLAERSDLLSVAYFQKEMELECSEVGFRMGHDILTKLAHTPKAA